MENKELVGTLLYGDLSYKDMVNIYSKWFSLSGIPGEIDTRFALISLICTITNAQKKKNPDVGCYEVIRAIRQKNKPYKALPDNFLKGLAVVCEDYFNGSTTFNDCGIKTAKDMIIKINSILDAWLPF